MKNYKIALKIVWIIAFFAVITAYLIYPNYFKVDYITNKLNENHNLITFVYVLFTIFRSLFFIPATFALILGLALFPDELTFLFIINMFGIIAGASLLYLGGKFFTPEHFFSEKKMKSLPKIKSKINEYGFGIVLIWSFFPFVPTDLICYVAGATRMQFIKFITAVFLGEIILVSIYLYTGESIMNLLF